MTNSLPQPNDTKYKTCSGCSPNEPIPIERFRVRTRRGKLVRESKCITCERKAKREAARRYRQKVADGEIPRPASMKNRGNVFSRTTAPDRPLRPEVASYKRVFTPIGWPGGLQQIASQVVQFIPVDSPALYAEPFCGAASVLMALPRYGVEILNDTDEGLINFLRVCSDEPSALELKRRLDLTPYSRRVYEDARENAREWEDGRYVWRRMEDEIDWAWHFFVMCRQAFAGIPGNSWGFSRTNNTAHGVATPVAAYLAGIDRLPEVQARLRGVQVECHSWEYVFSRYDRKGALFFVDPPYPPSTVKSEGMYTNHLSMADHKRLVEVMLEVKGMVVSTMYVDEELHAPLWKAGWARHDIPRYVAVKGRVGEKNTGVGSMMADKQNLRIESVLVCPKAQKALQAEGRTVEYQRVDPATGDYYPADMVLPNGQLKE